MLSLVVAGVLLALDRGSLDPLQHYAREGLTSVWYLGAYLSGIVGLGTVIVRWTYLRIARRI